MRILPPAPAAAPSRLGLLPGAFNPCTKAHLGLAGAALEHLDLVALVLPEAFPHKSYEGPGMRERSAMLAAVAASHPRLVAATSSAGLFIDIAREARLLYPSARQVSIICGRDAAERAAKWDYRQPGAFQAMLEEFDLLVAARHGSFQPPPAIAARVRYLNVAGRLSAISSTEVRERIRRGEKWQHLVPQVIAADVERLYS